MSKKDVYVRAHLKRVRKLPNYKAWTSQYRFKLPDGRVVKVYQSLRSYAIGKRQRMFVKIDGKWYELGEEAKLKVF